MVGKTNGLGQATKRINLEIFLLATALIKRKRNTEHPLVVPSSLVFPFQFVSPFPLGTRNQGLR